MNLKRKNTIKRGGSTSNLLGSMNNLQESSKTHLRAKSPNVAMKRRGSTSDLKGSTSDQPFFWDEVKENYNES